MTSAFLEAAGCYCADGSVMEGMTSNFLAVVDGEVFTAGEGILLGTVRDLVIQECNRNGVNVNLRPPNIKDIARWDGCMISSTSRLALPVDIVEDVHQETQISRTFKREGLVADIETWVSLAVDSASEPLEE
jgi:branched-subunit amino acid aminotransferase/4-amino-4-deoxychorismate lyase